MNVLIVIPCYDEKETIERIVEAVGAAPVQSSEIIVVTMAPGTGHACTIEREAAPNC